MSALPAAAASVVPFPRVVAPPGLDYTGLLRLTCFFHDLQQARIQVLDDEEGEVTRFLCRAPRSAFRTREEFVAAAVKRYLGAIADQRLAEMIYVATLFQAGMSERVSIATLTERVERAFAGEVPAAWLGQLCLPELWDAAVLDPRTEHLELVVRGARWWLYGLVEG